MCTGNETDIQMMNLEEHSFHIKPLLVINKKLKLNDLKLFLDTIFNIGFLIKKKVVRKNHPKL